MHIKEGIIPAVLGTAVTATGLALKSTTVPDAYRNGIIGFGVAHIVLGSVEMMNSNHKNKTMMSKLGKAVNFR